MKRRWLKRLTSLARHVLFAVNVVVPKRQKAVLSGFPEGEDSIMEIARVLAARGDIETVVLTNAKRVSSSLTDDGILWCRKKSARGLLHYLTAKYVFFTHGLYLSPKPPISQFCVNVWHGMPIKRIGHLIGRTPPQSSMVVATSQMFKGLVARCFAVPVDKVLVTGIPRNDVMVRAASRSQMIKQAIGISKNGASVRLIVWLPTFRKAVQGIKRTDGRDHPSIFGMNDMDVGAFAAFLQDRNCVCIIKPHPMAPAVSEKLDSDWLKICNDDDLRRLGISLYEMVGAADLLITDASSVYVDYLMLNKPVVIAFPDIDEYRASRGFALEPVEDYFAGPLARNFGELTTALALGLDKDTAAEHRARTAALFHDNIDDGATKRLLDIVCPRQPDRVQAASLSQSLRRRQISVKKGR